MALTTVKSDQIQTSVALAGSPTTTTQSASDNSTKVATTAYVETAVANLVASAPAALNTLDELAAALNDDASFSTTVTNSIATKLPLAGGTMTGALNISTSGSTRSASFVGNGIEVKHPTGASDLFIGSQTGNDVKLSVAGANALRLYTNGTERLNISGTGGLVVTSDANPALEVSRGSANTTNVNLKYNTTLTGQLSAADEKFQISAAGSGTEMEFYVNGAKRLEIDTSGGIAIDPATSSSTSTATPASLTLGRTFSNAAGQNPKLTLWGDSGEFMGLGISANQLEYIVTNEIYDHVFYGGNSGTTEIARITGQGSVGIGLNPNESVGAPLQIQSSTGYVGLRLNGTGSAGVWDLYSSYSGGVPMFGIYDRANTRYNLVATQNNRIGIGTEQPAVTFEVHGSNHLASFVNTSTTANHYSQIQIKAGSALNWIWTANQNSTSWGGANSLNIQSTSGAIQFFTNSSTARMKIHATNGNVDIQNGNLTFANGHGIDFSAHTTTSVANTAQQSSILDDYEEGTWFPYFYGDGNSQQLNNSQQKGSYVKIGNLVHVTFYIGVTSNPNGATGNIRLGGLPYGAVSNLGTNMAIVTGSVMVDNLNIGSSYSWVVPYMSHGTDNIQFYRSGNSVGWAQVPIDTVFAAIGEITYRV